MKTSSETDKEERGSFCDGRFVKKWKIDKKKLVSQKYSSFGQNVEEGRQSLINTNSFDKKHKIQKEKIHLFGNEDFDKNAKEDWNCYKDKCTYRENLSNFFEMGNKNKADACKEHSADKARVTPNLPEGNKNGISYSNSRKNDIDFLVKYIKNNLHLICICSKRLYVFNGKIFIDISDKKQAIAYFKKFLAEEINHLFRDYSEIYNQLLSEADINVNSIVELPVNRDVIVFQNGTYDVKEQKFYKNQFWAEDYIFSILATDYDENDYSGKDIIDCFLDGFCAGKADRKKLFCEILGFCLSNYENKKACFYFIGVPDAGKSTVCRFIEQVIGDNLYMACPIKDLNGKYVTGGLFGIKVCADEDVAINKPLKSEDIALIKKITSSDKILTRQIYKESVSLRPECKLVWAGNGMVKFATSEDLQPLINRMVIFPLDVPVPEEQRDPDILSKLLAGRNYMITLSLNALHDLVQNRFSFSEVVDTKNYFDSKIHINGIEEFIKYECVLEADGIVCTTELYGEYKGFCNNYGYTALALNQFIPYLIDKYKMKRHNDGKKRKIQGIRLLNDKL